MSGPFAGHSGLLALGMVLATLAACCPQKQDPDDPAATDQAQFVDAWLDDLQAGRDAEAFERLQPRPDLDGWGLERFTARVDRLGMLRGPASITWEAAHWRWQESNPNRKGALERRVLACIANANPSLQLEGTLQHAATTHSLSLVVSMHDGMRIKDLEIDEQPLIPTGRSNIVTRTPEPEPVGSALAAAKLERYDVGPNAFLRVRSELVPSEEQSVALRANCRYDGEWVQHETHGRARPLTISTRLQTPLPSICSVTAELLAGAAVQTRAWCWTDAQTQAGPCAEQPLRPSEAAVRVDRVAPEVLSDGSYTLNYDITTGTALAKRDPQESRWLAIELACKSAAGLRSTRPVSLEQYPAGLRKPVGALFGVRAENLEFPCTVTVEFTRSSPYERSTQTLYEGCATTTDVDAGPCP